MSSRPGSITDVLTVDIPRPRDPDSVRRSPRYLALRSHIWQHLKREVAGDSAMAKALQ